MQPNNLIFFWIVSSSTSSSNPPRVCACIVKIFVLELFHLDWTFFNEITNVSSIRHTTNVISRRNMYHLFSKFRLPPIWGRGVKSNVYFTNAWGWWNGWFTATIDDYPALPLSNRPDFTTCRIRSLERPIHRIASACHFQDFTPNARITNPRRVVTLSNSAFWANFSIRSCVRRSLSLRHSSFPLFAPIQAICISAYLESDATTGVSSAKPICWQEVNGVPGFDFKS